MKYLLLICSVLLSINIFSQEKTDSVEIVQLLKDDYQTMAPYDIKKHLEYCTNDYVLIENGDIWNMEIESEHYKKNAHRKIARKDYFEFKYLRIFTDIAYAVYNLKSDITENGKLITKNWNESVIFRKLEGKWKIELIHSTPIVTGK